MLSVQWMKQRCFFVYTCTFTKPCCMSRVLFYFFLFFFCSSTAHTHTHNLTVYLFVRQSKFCRTSNYRIRFSTCCYWMPPFFNPASSCLLLFFSFFSFFFVLLHIHAVVHHIHWNDIAREGVTLFHRNIFHLCWHHKVKFNELKTILQPHTHSLVHSFPLLSFTFSLSVLNATHTTEVSLNKRYKINAHTKEGTNET